MAEELASAPDYPVDEKTDKGFANWFRSLDAVRCWWTFQDNLHKYKVQVLKENGFAEAFFAQSPAIIRFFDRKVCFQRRRLSAKFEKHQSLFCMPAAHALTPCAHRTSTPVMARTHFLSPGHFTRRPRWSSILAARRRASLVSRVRPGLWHCFIKSCRDIWQGTGVCHLATKSCMVLQA